METASHRTSLRTSAWEAEKGLTDGLCELTKVDNERALDVGELSRGKGTLKVRKPNAPEGGSHATIREESG